MAIIIETKKTHDKGTEIQKQDKCPDCGQTEELIYWTLCTQWICKHCLNYWYNRTKYQDE